MESNSISDRIKENNCAENNCAENKCTETENSCVENTCNDERYKNTCNDESYENIASFLQQARLAEELSDDNTTKCATESNKQTQPTVVSPLAVFDPNGMDDFQKHYTTQFINKFLEIEHMISLHPASSMEGSYTRRCFSVAMQYLEGARDQIMRGIHLQNFKMQQPDKK